LLRREATVSDEWLTRHVTPRISGAFGPAVGAILARPLLWGAFDPEVCERVFPALRHRIVGEFLKLERSIGDCNPVEKVTVIASEGCSFHVHAVLSVLFCRLCWSFFHFMSVLSFSFSFLSFFIQLAGKSALMSLLLHQRMKDLEPMRKLLFVLHQGTVSSIDKQ